MFILIFIVIDILIIIVIVIIVAIIIAITITIGDIVIIICKYIHVFCDNLQSFISMIYLVQYQSLNNS